MKDNMKKIYLFLLAAAGILAVASCAREELIDKSGEAVNEETTTLTFSFGETKTALVDGKTTWEAGDKIRVYTSNAGFYRDVEVPAEAVGKVDVVQFRMVKIQPIRNMSACHKMNLSNPRSE